jgi:hypothetical protein
MKRKNNTDRRNKAIKERFKELYKVNRKRYDDCITALATEFFVTEATINRVLAT